MHLRDALAATHATNELMEGRKVPTECQRELTEFSCFLSADFRIIGNVMILITVFIQFAHVFESCLNIETIVGDGILKAVFDVAGN